jgi:cation:H+ antiporter
VQHQIQSILENLATGWLMLIAAVSLYVLSLLADIVVEQAVTLSKRSGIPKVIVGATIVSLGTTAPEVAVSVFAAFNGNPQLAMGNAVGSIICDTGLILGIACLIAPLQIPMAIANRQGWVQLGSGVLLVLLSIPWLAPLSPFTQGASGNFSQVAGFVFLALLGVYLWLSVRWSKLADDSDSEQEAEEGTDDITALIVTKLIFGIMGVVFAANILIPAVSIVAARMGIPQSIIAATLVAFGTSLPELTTSIAAARKGHGDLAIGNIIGADVLNALFVAGAAAAVTSDGLTVTPDFFQVTFPAMLIVLIVFRIGILTSKKYLSKPFGFVLLGTYIAYITVSIAVLGLGSLSESHEPDPAQATETSQD